MYEAFSYYFRLTLNVEYGVSYRRKDATALGSLLLWGSARRCLFKLFTASFSLLQTLVRTPLGAPRAGASLSSFLLASLYYRCLTFARLCPSLGLRAQVPLLALYSWLLFTTDASKDATGGSVRAKRFLFKLFTSDFSLIHILTLLARAQRRALVHFTGSNRFCADSHWLEHARPSGLLYKAISYLLVYDASSY